MTAVPRAIILELKKKYPKPSIDPVWLQACYEWVVNEHGFNPRQTDEIFAQVEIQYLGSDLADSSIEGSGFPANVQQIAKGRIATSDSGGAILCQMNAIMEIGHSAFSLRNVRQARIDKADMAGLAAQDRERERERGREEGEEIPQDGEDYTIPSYPRSTLRFELSDGFRKLNAMEYRPLPSIKLGEIHLGCKFILHDVLIRRGIAFLDPDSVTILHGTRVEELDDMKDTLFSRGLRRRMGLPEIDAEEEEMQRAQQREEAAQHQPPQSRPSSSAQTIAPAPIPGVPHVRVAHPVTPPIQRQSDHEKARTRTAPHLSATAKADRLLKIQRMLEDAQPGQEDEFDMEDARNAYAAEPATEGSRVTEWIQTSDQNYLHPNPPGIDDDSFDLSPSQEIAINDAALQQFERNLARSRSPTKRASPVKRHGPATAADAERPRGKVPTTVIDLVDSDNENQKQSPRWFTKTLSTSTPSGRLRQPVKKERSKTPNASKVIDLSD